MNAYTEELEQLITNVLLPIYLEHYRLLGRPSPIGEINEKLLSAMKKKRKIPILLQRESYGRQQVRKS